MVSASHTGTPIRNTYGLPYIVWAIHLSGVMVCGYEVKTELENLKSYRVRSFCRQTQLFGVNDNFQMNDFLIKQIDIGLECIF